MRKIRELLRLCWEQHLPQRRISQSLGQSQGSVSDYLNQARRAGLTWPLPEALDDARLEALLFPPTPDAPSDQRPVPDWATVHRDLRRPNMTLALLRYVLAVQGVGRNASSAASEPSRPARSATNNRSSSGTKSDVRAPDLVA
jgi:hypothetical protein